MVKNRGAKTLTLFICFALVFMLMLSGGTGGLSVLADTEETHVITGEEASSEENTAAAEPAETEAESESTEAATEAPSGEEVATEEVTEEPGTAAEEETQDETTAAETTGTEGDEEATEEAAEEASSAEDAEGTSGEAEEGTEQSSEETTEAASGEETEETSVEETSEEESSEEAGALTLKSKKVSTQATKKKTTATRKIGYINAAGLRVRSGAGTGYSAIAELSYVTVVILDEKYDSARNLWYKISFGNSTGYVISGQNGTKYVTNIKTVTVDTTDLNDFSAEYRDMLVNILAVNPNYTFTSENINYTLEEAARWHTAYKTSGNAPASYDTVLKYMDPATYITTRGIYAFAEQKYNETQTVKGLTEMLSTYDAFLNTDSYKKALVEAGKKTGVNPYVLAATILIEKGWNADEENPDVYGRKVWSANVRQNGVNVRSGPGTNYGVIGTVSKGNIYVVGNKKDSAGKKWYWVIYNGHTGYVSASYINNVKYYNTYYNLFSVNQTDNDPVVGGIYYAMKKGWTSPEKSLIGGATFYSEAYIDNDQDTYYYKDFNVNHDKSSWWHEYAGGITDVISSAHILSYAYTKNPLAKLSFRIPVYKTSKSSSKTVKGDANGDGKVSAADYIVIKNHIMGSKKISGTAAVNRADVNGDGRISSLDYVTVKNMIMGR